LSHFGLDADEPNTSDFDAKQEFFEVKEGEMECICNSNESFVFAGSQLEDDSATQPVTQPIEFVDLTTEINAENFDSNCSLEYPDIVDTLIQQFNNSYEGTKMVEF
jgi:hypothetical protein